MGNRSNRAKEREPQGVNNSAEAEAAQNVGLLGMMGRFVRGLPGADLAEEQLNNVERRVLRELKQRMDRVDGTPRLPAPAQSAGRAGQANKQKQTATTTDLLNTAPGQLLADLLRRAEEQTEEQARDYLYAMILRELVPDEARLLGALSDGEAHALVHVCLGPPIGAASRRVAENFTNLGKTATLKLKDFTPAYISHLRNLDLVETGPEDKALEIKYQILESDRTTRQAAEYAQKHSGPGMSVKHIRRVIRISPLGKELWERCHGLPPDAE